MRKALPVLLGGLFLLLLSALVTCPDPAKEPVAYPPVEAALTAPRQAQQALDSRPAEPAWQSAARSARPGNASALPPRPRGADANGRVVTALRYAHSVYQVFRAGVAGG